MIANRSVAELLVRGVTPLVWDHEKGSLIVDWSMAHEQMYFRALVSTALTLIWVCIGFAILLLPLQAPVTQVALSMSAVFLSIISFAASRVGFWAAHQRIDHKLNVVRRYSSTLKHAPHK